MAPRPFPGRPPYQPTAPRVPQGTAVQEAVRRFRRNAPLGQASLSTPGTALPRSMALAGASSPLGKIMAASLRLNPCVDLEADIVAVQAAAKISTQADWTSGYLSNVAADAMGVLTLTTAPNQSIASNIGLATVLNDFSDGGTVLPLVGAQPSKPTEEILLDFFLEPGTLPTPITLNGITLLLGRQIPRGTNSILWSQDFTNAVWSKGNCHIGGSTTAPDGSATAQGVIGNAVTALMTVTQTAIGSNLTNQAYKVYVKQGAATWMIFRVNDNFGTIHDSWFNLSTGAFSTTGSGITTHVWSAANGFWEIEIDLNSSSSGGAGSVSILPANADAVTAYTGDGVTVAFYAWGMFWGKDQASIGTGVYVATTTAPANIVATFSGSFQVQLYEMDDHWNRKPLGQKLTFDSTAIPASGLTPVTFDVTSQKIKFAPQRLTTRSGAGVTSGGALRPAPDNFTPLVVAKALSVGISVTGLGATNACIGASDNALVANLNPATFWRAQSAPGARACGPYSPNLLSGGPLDLTQNPDGYLTTGAVPGYGAVAILNGYFGKAIRVAQRNAPHGTGTSQPWAIPYYDLRAATFASSGTATNVVDLGSVPTSDVEFKADYLTPGPSTVTFSLRGSNVSAAGGWTAIGTVTDGQILTTPNRFRWYEVTTTLAGGNLLNSPQVQAVFLTARVKYATTRYDEGLDATSTVDPVTGDSGVTELKLNLLKASRDQTDLATMIASGYAPTNLECRVYAVDRIGGTRLYLNSFRLETRTSSDLDEQFTWLSGIDRLLVQVPPPVESYVFTPDPATQSIQAIAVNGDGTVTLTFPLSANFPTALSNEWGLQGSQGYGCYVQQTVNPGISGRTFLVVTGHATGSNSFTIFPDSTNAADYPAVGDLVQLHSQWFTRNDVSYPGTDYATIYADILTNQAKVPPRLIGRLPPLTARPNPYLSGGFQPTNPVVPTVTYAPVIQASGNRTALDCLKEVALHCGGAVVWEGGQLQFVSLYDTNGVTVAAWDERHYVTLETPQGADRRMPVIVCPWGYDVSQGKFLGEVQTPDYDALYGQGLPNLQPITKLSDTLGAWGDYGEARFLTQMLSQAWSTGVRIWKITLTNPHPWLNIGDQVAIATDQYVDHAARFAGDGITDTGTPVAGRIYATGRIVAKNLWGLEFSVMIPGLSAIAATTTNPGQRGGPYAAIAIPSDLMFGPDVRGNQTSAIGAIVATYTPPATPYFFRMEYLVASRATGTSVFGPVATVVGTKSGTDRILANAGTDVQITPVTVTTAQVRNVGTPTVVTMPGFAPPAPTITVLAGSAQITYTITLDPATKYVEVWGQTFATGSQPASASSQWNAAGATKSDTLRAGDGRTSIRRPVGVGSEWDEATFVPFDANNVAGTPISFLTNKTAGAAPSAPTAASNVSVTSSSVTNQVTMPASVVNFDYIRVYKNGAVFGSDIARTAGALGVQSVTHSGLSAGEYDAWQYSGVNGTTGDESTKTTAFNTTTAGGTIPTPSITMSYNLADYFAVTVTPAGGTPSGVTWHLKIGQTSGSESEDASAASTSTALTTDASPWTNHAAAYVKVWGVLSGYTNSADSNEASATRNAS